MNWSCDLRANGKLWRKRLTDQINYEGVHRTALATPGLLKIQNMWSKSVLIGKLINPEAGVERESKVKSEDLICLEGGRESKPLMKAVARAEAMGESNLGALIEESNL